MSRVLLAIDVGEARVGLAICDPDGVLASPLVTLRRDRRSNTDISDIVHVVRDRDVRGVIVGHPVSLSGERGKAAIEAERYAGRLAKRIAPVPVRLHDERLTTVIAGRTLANRGVRGKRQRAVVDQAAAVVILQSWLDEHGGMKEWP